MITIPLNYILVIYILITLILVVFSVFLFYGVEFQPEIPTTKNRLKAMVKRFLCKRPSRKITASKKDLFSCPVCAYRYIISRSDEIHRCPQCNSLNKPAAAEPKHS